MATLIVPVFLKFQLIKRRYHGKTFYKRCVYESVDDRRLSYAISQNLTGWRFHAGMI